MCLRPYRQKSHSDAAYTKLSKHFYGTFCITEGNGKVFYRLEVQPQSRIHPVFHCSLLKPHHGPVTTSNDLPPSVVQNHPLVEPLAIINQKLDTTTDPPNHMVLVQWKGLALKDTSWEDWNMLQQKYHLEDKVIFPNPVDVSKSPILAAAQQNTKPKRLIKKLAHLKNCV